MANSNDQLFIPGTIRYGAQNREGTYNGKLAYLIYRDKKGVLRKEKSWNSWRDHKIAPKDYDNVPTEGFVLNKKVGGHRTEWSYRDAHVRVYDPRGFEFEIDVPNLLFILSCCDCSRGKGLEGSFVYAWSGTELVLLPTVSQDYARSKEYTELQGTAVHAKDLVAGRAYVTKKQQDLVYLGRFDYHFMLQPGGYRTNKKDTGVCKRYVFWDPKAENFVAPEKPNKIAACKNEAPTPDLAALVTKYGKSAHGSKVASLFLKEAAVKKEFAWLDPAWYFEKSPGEFYECDTTSYNNKISYVRVSGPFSVKNGVLVRGSDYGTMYPPGSNYGHAGGNVGSLAWREPTTHRLFAKMESGATIRYTREAFEKQKGM